MKIPIDWKRLPEEIVTKRFPYRLKPQEIYGSLKPDRMITLNLLEKQLHEKQIHPAIMEIQKLIGHIYPKSIHEAVREMRTAEGTAGWFSFITGGAKGDHCHCMFVLSIYERMLFGGYHFPMERMKAEREIFLKTVMSMRSNESI